MQARAGRGERGRGTAVAAAAIQALLTHALCQGRRPSSDPQLVCGGERTSRSDIGSPVVAAPTDLERCRLVHRQTLLLLQLLPHGGADLRHVTQRQAHVREHQPRGAQQLQNRIRGDAELLKQGRGDNGGLAGYRIQGETGRIDANLTQHAKTLEPSGTRACTLHTGQAITAPLAAAPKRRVSPDGGRRQRCPTRAPGARPAAPPAS